MKFKNKAVSIILSTAMIPVILPVGVFQSSQVCHAVETISVKDAFAELVNPKIKIERSESLHRAIKAYCLSKNILDKTCFYVLQLKEYIRSNGRYIGHAKEWCKELSIKVKANIMLEQPDVTSVSRNDVVPVSWDEFSDDVLKNRMYTHDPDSGIVVIDSNDEEYQDEYEYDEDIQIVD